MGWVMFNAFTVAPHSGDFSWMINLNRFITRLKCKSCARVKIVVKNDWIVKKVKFLKNVKKMFKKSEKIIEK